MHESDLRGFFRQDEGEKPQEYFVYFKVLRQNHGGKRPQSAEVAFDQRLLKKSYLCAAGLYNPAARVYKGREKEMSL